mgnify:CR=1 FL=1
MPIVDGPDRQLSLADRHAYAQLSVGVLERAVANLEVDAETVNGSLKRAKAGLIEARRKEAALFESLLAERKENLDGQ